ncbi:putative tRNA pseudouridine synthase Pus10 [Drosophila pseudoobscura]|uniref:tRNA pseudouridine(55) synthase n=1 Tax=Drosophila pseudoobscura pseudoobscura TaxID=46245 RepID=A0A6I8UJJ5_DROPS|nr:putative tRNA pseudouridine synthase Pus10 [Drosophila pseudoobscura]
MKNQELVDYLMSCGVCKVCQLRYLRARGSEYNDIHKSLQRLGVKVTEDQVEDEDNVISTDEQPLKKPRLSHCSTCLGIFSEDFQRELIEGIIASEFGKYDSEGIVLAITMPMSLQLRQLSMWFALQRKFGSTVHSNSPPDVPIKEAVKLILHPIICKKLDKKYDANGLVISIDLRHKVEEEEVDKLVELNRAAFPGKALRRVEISRGLLEKQYQPSRVKAETFEKYLPIPPTAVDESLSLKSVDLQGPMVCVAGRYRKLSRELSHTPWLLQGVRQMEDSIEEIIIRSVGPHFTETVPKITFMSSGREDVDVRCLGKGRPFVLEIPNSRRSTLTREQALAMEQAVDTSGKVSILNLQVVPREQAMNIKTGEEQKRKYYRALCALKEPATLEMLQKLQISESFDIQQKTPIRVLHRRPLHTRPRTIYSVKARLQRDNPLVLVIDIVTQAGTYIKELVHGEFGRTTPSFSSIIGKPIDIQALDVVGIDLDWPPEVDNSVAE